MRTHSICIPALLLLATLTAPAAFTTTTADTTLPFVSPMFGDNMVLQRGKPNTIWGWSKPGEAIRVEISGHTANTVTGADRRWQLKIEPPAPGGPYTIRVVGP